VDASVVEDSPDSVVEDSSDSVVEDSSDSVEVSVDCVELVCVGVELSSVVEKTG